MKILVAEDDPISGKLLQNLLSIEGHEVVMAKDGQEAWELFQGDRFRFLITDWMMPKMDGPTLCRHVRARDNQQYSYIVLLTSKGDASDAVAGLEAGADDFVTKPFDKNELLARIRTGKRIIELEDKYRDTAEKLSQNEKMAAVGHLAAGVAHEINNPVGFIRSNLNSLSSYHDDLKRMVATYRELIALLYQPLSEKAVDPQLTVKLQETKALEKELDMDFILEDLSEMISDCVDGTERIANIVHEMRFFAHPEKQIFQSEKISELIDIVLQKIAVAPEREIKVEKKIANAPSILCNGEHIRQVIQNIVTNAIEAMERGGRLLIDSHLSDRVAKIVIADDGKGIAPEHLKQIFNPFFTTKEVGQGIGFGLTTAMNIVKMHRGDIQVDSNPGKGTSVTIELPAPPPENIDGNE